MSGIGQIAKNLGGVISKNSPSILTGLSVAGLITTAVLAVKATPKAIRLLEEERERKTIPRGFCQGEREVLTRREIVRATWKCYIPATAIGAASIACIIGANTISLRRTAAIASVYSVTEAAFKTYQEKVVEQIGRNKEQKVHDEIAADTIKAHPPVSNEVIFTGKGDVLCYDTLSGRYFKSDIETIRRIINKMNQTLLVDMFLSANDWYYELGLEPVKLGEDTGWDIAKGLIEVRFSTQLTEDGTPCLVLNYTVAPRFSE